ncbi:MAG TPA: hypothetical protein VLB85_14325, partial [Acidimicrobiia bacterium]|nr:hypothetical protein [Acidimicrobiia bacterium]
MRTQRSVASHQVAAAMSESRLSAVFKEIRERRVIPWTLAYFAGAWVLLEATGFLGDEFGWADWIVPAFTIILGFGIPSAITLAWFHGAAGWQRITRQEAAVHSLIAASLLVAFLLGPPLPDRVGPGVGELPLTRVAVLYFKDHSEGGGLDPLSRELTEAVVHRLAQVPALDVLPLSAVGEFRDVAAPLHSIVAALGTGSLLEGSITELDDQFVVTAQLIEARS